MFFNIIKQEIKDLKKQVTIRDNDISTTTKQINKLEMNLCQALDENDEMRRRLGLEPSENIDLSGIYSLMCLFLIFQISRLTAI